VEGATVAALEAASARSAWLPGARDAAADIDPVAAAAALLATES